MSFVDWQNSIVGHQFDGDNDGSFDCVDVPESWVLYLWPQNPEALELGYGNAKDIYAGSNSSFFNKIDYSTGLVPMQGDIIVFGATPSNPYGHIAVVISANDVSVSVIQENSYTQQAAYIGTLGYSYCLGFLRPLINIEGEVMITKEDEMVLSQLATGDNPGADYNYQFTGTSNWDACLNFWLNQSQLPNLQNKITDLTNQLKSSPAPVIQDITPPVLPNLNPLPIPVPTDPTPANQEKVNIFVALWKAIFG